MEKQRATAASVGPDGITDAMILGCLRERNNLSQEVFCKLSVVTFSERKPTETARLGRRPYKGGACCARVDLGKVDDFVAVAAKNGFASKRLKPFICSRVMVGGMERSWRLLGVSTRAGPSCSRA